MDITYHSIGVIHSPFTEASGMPIQPTGAVGSPGTVEILPELAEGLKDLESFSHLILIYHLHEAGPVRCVVTPFLDDEPHGVFATRAPARPNAIGFSVVELVGIESNILRVSGVDVLDGTPLLDIKPYVPAFDAPETVRTGWLEKAQGNANSATSDDRFSKP
jgi:tRNA-Thr(GGU) m(6)t(6)A37 methyltransferase TsaA